MVISTTTKAKLSDTTRTTIGLVVLSQDESAEDDFRTLFDETTRIHVSRIMSPDEISVESCLTMAPLITATASLFPRSVQLTSVGYGCTSATSVIGAERVSQLLKAGCDAANTTNPLTAAVAACSHLGVSKCGMVTPYVLEVNKTMIDQFEVLGSITTECLVSFVESNDYQVARIDPESMYEAAVKLAEDNVGKIDFLFLSCTNLRTLSVISQIENETGIPCLSSNLCWAWHMAQQSGAKLNSQVQSKLIQSSSAMRK
ncbi:hypothetical protein TL16_g02422 [Triparma laevis f. inornata]|uniref:Asp/Glu racemase n=2 Tax=Triparma laevis TaxID=1534972 RepID=A0A9W7FIG6_9STRA|nr:hypothetical protein TL16_g02422 [Triparma laevis f. inornata]GMI12675.1 hypothetical protein TrLO_g4172 [Triparma laevis f. longispina]